ncbi:MAG: hypothetical protein QOE86_4661 [Solirubrobacteraceae bacterium]|nr:hypothetical protein [Solirubrobacteraceae bacterium]
MARARWSRRPPDRRSSGRVSRKTPGWPIRDGSSPRESRRRVEPLEHDPGARRQRLLAEFGARALDGGPLQDLLHEAAWIVSAGLGTPLAAVAEILPGRRRLVLRAGVGWPPGAVGQPMGTVGGPGGDPMVSDDLAQDPRFGPAPFGPGPEPASAVAVRVAGPDEAFGSLVAYAMERRSFTQEDTDFLRVVAHVLHGAIERSEAAHKLDEVRDAERWRIARALNDDVLHDLGWALTRAQGCAVADAGAGDGSLADALQRIGDRLRSAIHDLRVSSHRAWPLSDRLQELVAVHRRMMAAGEIELRTDGLPGQAVGETASEILRILGEALTNARRRSGAPRITLHVWVADGRLRAELRDDGPPPGGAGDGLAGMRDRAALLGACIELTALPGGGTSLRLEVPLEAIEPRGEALRVLLVEDHSAVRESMAAAFEREPDVAVVEQAASLEQARGLLTGVDVAIIDLGLPDGEGSDLIPELRQRSPEAQAIVLSAHLDRSAMARAIQRGAAGTLSKDVHLVDVVSAVRRVRNGETLVPLEEVVELLRVAGREREREYDDRRAIDSLTPRELEVLQLLAEGLDSQGSAERLHISVRTLRNHVSNILTKLGTHSQLQALLFALRYDLVEVPRSAS